MIDMTNTEQEAQDFLNSLTTTPDLTPVEDLGSALTGSEKWMFSDNESIIKNSNKILKDRLECEDESLSIKDIISMKAEAFKNNQTLTGQDETTVDPRKIIPTTINIQVINN